MTTAITDILDLCARQCSVTAPANWITTTEQEHKELRDDFLFETVDEVLDRADWPEDIGQQTTITGDGSASYSLDASFLRLKRSVMSVLETTDTLRRPMIAVKNAGDWKYLQEIELNGLDRYYLLEGDRGAYTISIFPALDTGEEAVVSWVSENWAESSGGTGKYEFTDTGDVSRLPRRLIETGIVWRWRERYGLDYQTKLAEHTSLLSRYISDFRGRWPLSQPSRLSRFRNTDLAYPWEITSS